jgi:hypothetical protein
MRLTLLTALMPAWLALAGTARADITSGPEVGVKVPALPVAAVTGPVENKDVDYARERGGKPTVFLFVSAANWDRPMARFLRKLDGELGSVGEDSAAVAVWLSEKPDEAKDYLPRAQQSLQFQQTALTVFTGEQPDPKDWGINSLAHLTAVVAKDGKVVARFAYQSVNETDVPKVVEALKKALGK